MMRRITYCLALVAALAARVQAQTASINFNVPGPADWNVGSNWVYDGGTNIVPGDGFAEEAFCNVGTLATITEFSVPQPGLMMIRCVGTQRFEISAREKLKHGLWIADVTRLDDDQAVPVPDDLQRTANALGKLIKSLQERKVPDDQMPLLAPYQLEDCGWVANRWCELLPMPVDLKQRLMELDNPLLRLELVSDILDRTGIAL